MKTFADLDDFELPRKNEVCIVPDNKIYSRDEVVELLKVWDDKFSIPTMGFASTPKQDWIKENLK